MQGSNIAKPPVARAAHVQLSDQGQSPAKTVTRLALIVVAALLVLSIGLFTWYNLAHSGRVYNGVSVLGRELGGLTHDEAAAAITEATAGYPAGNVTVSGAGHTWNLSASDLGVSVDVPRTLDAALLVGRNGNFVQDIGTQIGSVAGSTQIVPILKTDSAQMDKAITQIAGEVDQAAVDSKLDKDADGKVLVTPSASGVSIDRQALAAALTQATATQPFGTAALTTQVQAPKVTEADLEGTKDQALSLTEQDITLSANDQTWTLKPADLRNLLSIEHSGNTLNAALSSDKLAAYLAPIAQAVHASPEDASVSIGDDGVILQKDKAGTELNTQAAIVAIQQAATKADGRNVDLPLNTINATIRTDQLQAIYEKANDLVTNGVRVRYGEDTYIMKTSSVIGFLSLEPTQGGPGLPALKVDQDALAYRISGIAETYVNVKPMDARFRMVNGTPTKVADAKQGVEVDVNGSVANVIAAVGVYTGGGTLEANLAVTTTAPNVTNADIATINTPDMLAYGQTTYASSSANRRWNVELGANNINGTLVPPGAIFSTVDTIGDLTLAAGFKMGYAIQGDGNGGLTTVPAEAGGICQVSTTLFHAVFRSGLQVVERNWHSYWISIYGIAPTGLQGLDATIAPPYKDFRFKNTTGNWLLIKAIPDGKNLTFQLWGVDPHWNVAIGKPVITNVRPTSQTKIIEYSDAVPAGSPEVMVEHAQDGFDSSITRVVTDSSGNVIDKWTATSSYQPAYNRYLRPKN
jgi:vancomycin resistance protein YoaR